MKEALLLKKKTYCIEIDQFFNIATPNRIFFFVDGTALFQFLTFLAIKVKLVLVIGFIFTIIVFGGKLFALIKYATLKGIFFII